MLSRDRSLLAGIFRDRISPIVNDFNKHMETLHSNITIHSHILHLQQEQNKKIDKLLEDGKKRSTYKKKLLRMGQSAVVKRIFSRIP